MKVDLYEKIWMIGAGAISALFVTAILFTSLAHGMHPQSHVETIDPQSARSDPRFAQPGVRIRRDGSAEVTVVAQLFSFDPPEIHVPAHRPVTFRLTSTDVIHGFEVAGTNTNSMIVPGYISQLTTRFDHPGEYLLVCNEYCGAGHHMMSGKLVVEEGGQ